MCFAPQRRALFRHLNFSKSGPNVVCFVHFDFEMCFAPQRRALFRYLNFQKWSDPGVFCTFWLRNVLRATTACTFSTSQLPKVVRPWCGLYILTSRCASRHNGVHFFDIATSKSVLYILTSKCASRHNGVQFFISSGQLAPHPPLQRAYFSTLRSPTSLEKHSVSRLSYLFAHLHLLSSYSFSFTLLSSNLSLLSASSLLCFSSVHIVGSLTSKLPSIIFIFLLASLAVTSKVPVNEGLIEGDWKLKLVTTLQKVRNLPQASGLELILIDFLLRLATNYSTVHQITTLSLSDRRPWAVPVCGNVFHPIRSQKFERGTVSLHILHRCFEILGLFAAKSLN